ncbi:uncharacterized protein LOC130629193 [Hydractinia symbiolongicarpus]|uniref:uncharacterized protein LOC130629193 n=1 Tax=Hydractinia symbiolongicarpus TaxID=13093 RepID=UPI0025506B05|nr:uncharacterized protein LOC130629193 [Hydractinia symbiolongicarpus]
MTDISSRSLPEQLINERDPTSNVYNSHNQLDWKDQSYIPGFVCRCAKKAFARGFKVIGIQNFAECWSGPTGELTYSKHGDAGSCVDRKYHKISHSKKCVVGAGEASTNFVYRIAPTACSLYYEPVGCYQDDLVKPRPLPEMLQTERDYTDTEKWNKILINWENWGQYSPEMICRCAYKARMEGKDYFGIQFWGECWAGDKETSNYSKIGKSEKCHGTDFQKCRCNSYHCVGAAYTNYVYKLISGPVIVD